MSRDGGDVRWVFQETPEMYIYLELYCAEECPITWSPDGNFLAFVAACQDLVNTNCMYRLDIQTGDLVILIDPYIFGNRVYSPDWGQ